jgi:hypothetical protein
MIGANVERICTEQNMAINMYRNDSLVQVETYETTAERANDLIEGIRKKWAFLRDKGLAGAAPVEILRNGAGSTDVKVIEVFSWKSQQDRIHAEAHPGYQDMNNRVHGLADDVEAGRYTQIIRGFNQDFPPTGGVELLKGVCSCLLNIDGMVKDFRMSVKNGIVLMHRSPRADVDGDGKNEMYLKILMHGGEMIQGALGPIRVEQNFNLPNDGIVKSHGGNNDFPATAIWRVYWRILTPLGAVLTDPETPLIFGPATVGHYPPVGTHFHSPTGPVKLILESTGKQIGTLTPGELTAFDIVVTKDDEIYADILNKPPQDLLDLHKQWADKVKEHEATTPAVALEEVF